MQSALRSLTFLALSAPALAAAQQPAGAAGPAHPVTSAAPAPPAASSTSPAASPGGTPYAPAPPPPKADTPASGTADYRPPPPAESPTTHAQPEEYKVWRLVSPSEANWNKSDPNAVRGWFRLETDARAFGFYVGGSYRLRDGLAFAPFAHLQGSSAEPNVALTWQLGAFWLMPAVGTTIDFGTNNFASLDPQLFAAADLKFVYVEAWAQYFLGSPFHTGTIDTFYLRGMLLGVINRIVAVGIQTEETFATKNVPGKALLAAPFGARTNLRIGSHDTLGLFVGYETLERARSGSDGIEGRFEYAHQW